MAAEQFDTSWIWHPQATEDQPDTAGQFVHFRRNVVLETPPASFLVQITADTRYKLFVNSQLVCAGPVKGDCNLWFYDEVDIAPYLRAGHNRIGVLVLRFFHATQYASSFPRSPFGGLRIAPCDGDVHAESQLAQEIRGSALWETAIDPYVSLQVDEPEDDFLHVYETASGGASGANDGQSGLEWVPAKVLQFQRTTGVAPPWNLSPRLIPPLRHQQAAFSALHNVQSSLPPSAWEASLLPGPAAGTGLLLPANSHHRLDLEAPHHMTAFLRVRFKRPQAGGSILRLRYAESYEDPPVLVPYLRRKGNRRDTSKALYGPCDVYEVRSAAAAPGLGYYETEAEDDVYVPFAFRTFRFIQLSIDVGASDLIFEDLQLETVNYPLDVVARLQAGGALADGEDVVDRLWTTSIRTLANCMHDTYEDCPFYEQLQYAMDTRSSVLFTYLLAGDDRLARQAMVQFRNSFQAHVGLTASRAPCQKPQMIPHFSLFWINMLADHWSYFGDAGFLAPFLPIVDAVLGYFQVRRDPATGLVMGEERTGIWNFVDWTETWRPYGVPPAAVRTGISTYTNHLYAYTLANAATLASALGRPHVAADYTARADDIVEAVRAHCFDGHFFTDGLACSGGVDAQDPGDYSVHNQVWAVLSGAVSGTRGQTMLRQCLTDTTSRFAPSSVAMSFYTLRALSLAGGGLYEERFHEFWAPWRDQLAKQVTTWEEDSVSQRSDCHAWGSAPVYEYMAEVAGVRPAKAGWAAIAIAPRLSLYPALDATVPLNMVDGALMGQVRVGWRRDAASSGETRVTLHVEMKDPERTVPVYITLPGQPMHVLNSGQPMEFVVHDAGMKSTELPSKTLVNGHKVYY